MAKKLFKILSLDGGGIRGILPATILKAIEEKTGKPTAELFDLVAGTSTGGIIAAGLLVPDDQKPAQPKYKAETLLNLYVKEGPRIFKKRKGVRVAGSNITDPTYEHEGLEAVLSEYFSDTTLKEVLKPLVITSYDLEKRMPFYFRSRLAQNRTPEEDFFLRHVARATSAAPTYFEPALIHNGKGERLVLVDGGVCANNPSIVAYGEAEELDRINRTQSTTVQRLRDSREHGVKKVLPEPDLTKASDYFMLSIGTGNGLRPYAYEKTKEWGALKWTIPAIDILMQGSAEVNHNHMQYIMPDSPLGRHYIRFNTLVDKIYSDMANAKPEIIHGLQAIADRFVTDNQDRIEYVCKMLME